MDTRLSISTLKELSLFPIQREFRLLRRMRDLKLITAFGVLNETTYVSFLFLNFSMSRPNLFSVRKKRKRYLTHSFSERRLRIRSIESLDLPFTPTFLIASP